jgi:superfamily II DNA or RNA helicase
MIKFRIEHHKTFIEEANADEIKSVKQSLRIWQDFFQRNSPQKFKYVSLYYSFDKSFPTGFLEEVKKKLTKKAVQFEIVDSRIYKQQNQKLEINPDFLEDLWENQEQAIEAIKKNEVGLISSPTGTGKTRIIANTIEIRKVKTLVIVPTTSIQKQMYKTLVAAFGSKNVSIDPPKMQ